MVRASRNAPCPCGSGKRFKHCCGQVPPPPPETPPSAEDLRAVSALVELVNRGALAEAEQRCGALLRTHPAAAMLWKILSVAQLRQGKDALPALRRAAQLLPEDPEAHANLGAELHARGQWQDALASLRQSLALERRNPIALAEAGDAQRALGNARQAIELYQWALELDPRRRDVHNNLGNAHLQLGEVSEALRAYRRALELKADDADVLGNLADALRQDGQLEAALECSQRALAIDARQPLAHNVAAVILGARGERPRAIAHLRAALASNPRYLEAFSTLGELLWEEGRRREAISAYEQATVLAPARAEPQCALGYALLQVRRAGEAAERFRAVLQLEPGHARAALGLAGAMRVLGQHEEAEASVRAALAREPRNAAALALLGELLADRGAFEEARRLFSEALAADPKCAAGYAGIAAHRRMTADDQQWLRGAEALVASGAAPADEMPVRYALGKYFDDIGDYERAFASYRAGNELARRLYPRYEREGLTRLVDHMVARCDAGFIARAHEGASDSDRPVFIIGMPRSGTSLAEQILASHPQVFGAGEIRFWDRALAASAGWDGEDARGRTLREQVVADYLRRLGPRAAAARRVVDKLPGNFLYTGVIHALLPRARFIHMQRDPLDTCVSVYFQNFLNATPFAHDLEDLAHYYRHYLRLMAHWRAVLPSGALLEVPYESLVTHAEEWTRRMLEFLGLEFDPRCLEFHRTERVVITASKWQVRQPLSTAAIGRWRHYEKYLEPLRHLVAPAA